jgi:hypothetical protein
MRTKMIGLFIVLTIYRKRLRGQEQPVEVRLI